MLLRLKSQLARLPLAAGEGDFTAIMQEAGIFHFAAQNRQVQMLERPGKDVYIEFVAYGGQEQYHGTLIDQAGKPRPFYADVKALAAEFVAASPIITDTIPAAQAALLYSFDSR